MNRAVPSDMAVDIGTVVQAMVINTLSGRSPLYMLEEFIRNQDTGVLLGCEVSPGSFNDTTIVFQSPGLSATVLEVFDLSGRRAHLHETTDASAGQHTLTRNGTGLRGESLPGGMYVIRLSGGGEVSTTRTVLIR